MFEPLVALTVLAACSVCIAGAEDPSVRMSLYGDAPDGMCETYTRRPSGLLFQQLTLRAAGATATYPGLEPVTRRGAGSAI